MAEVRIVSTARQAFIQGQGALESTHRAVDNIMVELGALASDAPVNMDRLIFVLSDTMVKHKTVMLTYRDIAGVDALAKDEMGDPNYNFAAAIDETVARIDALIAFIQATVPSTDVEGKKIVHFWELLPDGSLVQQTVTKQQLINAGLAPLLQGFVDDRV